MNAALADLLCGNLRLDARQDRFKSKINYSASVISIMIDFSTRVLRAMIALDELGHFSLAAERCNVTQSALSQMVNKLELDVDLRLVDRDRRRVTLTDEGRRFVATARRVMLEVEEIGADLRDHATRRKGQVMISALPSLAAHWLPPIVARHQASYPGIRIGLFDTVPDRALEMVRQRLTDFALTARGPGLAGLQSRLLFKEEFMLVCHYEHKFARRSRINLADLAGCNFIRLIRTGSIAQYLDTALREVSVNDTGLEVEQLATLAGLVANGLGVSVVPQSAIPYFNPLRVSAIPIISPDLSRPIYVVWPAANKLTVAAQGFVEMMDAAALQPISHS